MSENRSFIGYSLQELLYIIEMILILKSFNELSILELYALLQLRSAVFVVEQHCHYQDLDDKDQKSFHLMAIENDCLIAYCRLLPPGLSDEQPCIGRVVARIEFRGTGLGQMLMERAIAECYRLFGRQAIKIGAQLHLRKFYDSLGFTKCSDVYDDAGIEHIKMIKFPIS